MQTLRIGTRDSQLAVWQATLVQQLLKKAGVESELVYMKSEGDIDTVTPLYALGVTGVFTKTLDAALLNERIDLAVHSMKDVPVQLAHGIQQAAVLKRASHKDILVPHPSIENIEDLLHANYQGEEIIIATSSIRRIAQWKRKYPEHSLTNLRGNVNTRLKKLSESNWAGAIFAAAGLERIGLRPQHAIDLSWMLPAPAQGAIMVVCREGDTRAIEACSQFNDHHTALCTHIEREFLSGLMGGCSTPISALASIDENMVSFNGNIVSPDGSLESAVSLNVPIDRASNLGMEAARQVLANGGLEILDQFKKKGDDEA